MPRNAAKKTNKNAKRLPVLIKLTNSNLNRKKKKLYKNRNNYSSKNKTKKNYCTPIKEIKQKNKHYRNTKKVFGDETFTSFHRIQDDHSSLISLSIPEPTITTKTTTTTNKNLKKKFEQQKIDSLQQEALESILTTNQSRETFNLEEFEFNKTELKEQQYLNFENRLKNNVNNSAAATACKTEQTTYLSETSSKLLEPEPLWPATATAPSPSSSSLRSFSPNTSVSSLYPIVIESFQQDNNTDKEQQQGIDNVTSSKEKRKKNKKTHSINNCNGRNRKNNNNNTNNICTCCHTAVDTLEQHKSQNNNNNKNNACNNNNNNCKTTSIKHCNNSNKQKQSTQSSKTTTKVLTFSKTQSSSSSSANQSQEVKARLATLRIRKKVCQQHQQQRQEQSDNKTAQKTQKSSCSAEQAPESTTTVKDILQNSENKETNKTTTTDAIKQNFNKKVSPVLDQATLNLIETLNEEVKKPNNKRKRNNSTALLLGLASLHQPRPKRIANTSLSQVDKPLTACATVQDKNDQKQRTGNFIKPALVETTNTNSKKRARIMSLYERPFQTANDGRGGSVVSNGYMTSSRTSSSSGGASGAIVMNDNCDTQEMANQYYLAGTSGAGISGNSNPSLMANGGAINHAPTMGTLCNIGNTCYLNSVVYTLRFAPQFLHNLHHLLADLNALQQNIARARAKSSSLGRGISAVHMENARSWSSKDLASMEQYTSGSATNSSSLVTNLTALTQVTQKNSHQLLTEKLHDLYQSLHRNEISESMEPHHADTLLHAIQDVSSIFEGNQQQDAHEFLMCLLNSIRETSQTLIKAIAECPDVILNGYISNPDDIERELIKSHTSGSSGIGIAGGGSNSNNTNSLASASSKTSSFFSRKSKRKDDSKNSKSSRLQSPLKDALLSGNNPQTTTTANSLFYLNTNDLNATATTPASATIVAGVANSGSLTSPSNSSSSQVAAAGDETDTASTSVALIFKDKQRLEGKIKELGLDFFNEDFEGITVSTTKCLSCETITEKKETMIDIAVPVPQAGNEFMDRPSSFIQNSCITREYFRHENKYRCEQCCGYTEAIRSISYEVLPRLLIIQLSRFSGGMEKINSYIPTSFTLQCFCSKCCELSDANKLHIYKLYSVITHVGATMSVGHYIAYTCSLEWANEYLNCPKEQRRRASQERNLGTAINGSAGHNSSATAGNSQSSSSTATAGLSTSSTGFMKMKMKFGRSKASSSGDMSKNVKQLNGLNASSKAITNGIGKLSMNTTGSSVATTVTPQCPITCQSVNCCAMRLNVQQQLQYQSANNSTSDLNEEFSQYFNGSSFATQANYNNNVHHNFANTPNTSGYGSTGRGATKASYAATIQNQNCSEPIWYMCDDDKIKAMTQREFEELLSPARKITITPYLLFYARYNLQSTPPKSGTASTSSPGPVTSSPQTSWSNESLQSSGHSAHSSGMRM